MSEIKMLGRLPGHERKGGCFQTGYSVYGADGIAPTLLANGGGYGIMTVEIKQIGNFIEREGGRKNPSCGRVYDTDGISPTLNTIQGGGREPHVVREITPQPNKYRVRKLTPKECFRLMGVSDADADKMLVVNSNSQCYKQAGNSIVVPVLEAIFRNMNIKGVKTWSEAKGDKRNV